ncbi:MAG: 4-hydroxythreonine-4-phosphate dehydrogenase PdxA [Candidatus Omnitrophota bacterium]
MGDPAGIGPEVTAKAMASPDIKRLAIFTIIGDNAVLQQAFNGSVPSGVNILDPVASLREIRPGKPTAEGAKKALECIDAAARIMLDKTDKTPRAMVTAPVSKEAIAEVRKGFRGHTEYLQEASSAQFVTMAMIGKNLCVIPVTRHIPISEVAGTLNADIVLRTLKQVIENRSLLSENDPARIGVCALNPHCGEKGKIGTEEIDIIAPAVEEARKKYEHIEGPVAADVVFYRALKKSIDIVVSMYHDQGLGPFKMIDFDNGVNMTLGLGWVRTSPDHGTAFDIAGKGIADSRSMECAIQLAVRAITSI